MAKRTSRSRADDTAATAPAAAKAGRATGRTRKTSSTDSTEELAARESDDQVRAADSDPSEEEIRHRAYLRYLERGGGHGADFEDWLEAEKELRKKRGNG